MGMGSKLSLADLGVLLLHGEAGKERLLACLEWNGWNGWMVYPV